MTYIEGELGRLIPQDFEHVEKYPLQMTTTVTGVERFLSLPYSYRDKYNQGSEGACVGFSASWMQSIKNRKFFDATWLYKEAQKVDGWAGENYSGTSVRAGMDILRTRGHKVKYKYWAFAEPQLDYGIAANRWGRTIDELRTCIANGQPIVMGTNWYSAFDAPEQRSNGEFWVPSTNIGHVRGGHAWCIYAASDKRQAFKMVNSWGAAYPLTWFSYELMQRLIDEHGEATVVTDR